MVNIIINYTNNRLESIKTVFFSRYGAYPEEKKIYIISSHRYGLNDENIVGQSAPAIRYVILII